MTYFINEREITVVWIMKTLSLSNKKKTIRIKKQPRKKHKKD